MPKKPTYNLPPLKISKEQIGNNISRIRKENGLTQIDLADKIGITQTLVSDYETGRSNINSEMIIRFALALKTSSDEILGLDKKLPSDETPSLKFMKRLKLIEKLPESDQKALLKTIDKYIY